MKISRFFFWQLVFILTFFSCSTDGNLPDVLRSDPKVEAPALLDFQPVSSTEVVFTFSQAVSVVSVEFEPALEIDSIEDGSEVKVTFAKEVEVGIKITADILVEDSSKNTLNVIVPFRARNNRMPALVFNELRTEYSKPKVEFVEFLATGTGNLGAMRLFVASNSISEPAYEFPPVEVKTGEYIVLHLRTVEEGVVDETGSNLALSGGTDAHDEARDFWLPNSSELLRKSDALWLMDQDNRIIDAVIFNESDTAWTKDYVGEAAKFLGMKNAWLPLSGNKNGGEDRIPADAVISKGTTTTRTISRDESNPVTPRAGNWYITATNGATPGEKNKSDNEGVQQNSGSGNKTQAPVETPPPVETPVFLGYHPVSSTEIIFEFSLPVRIISFDFDSSLETALKKAEGREIKVTFTRPLDAGKTFTADIHVEDSNGNKLEKTIPFRARNDRMPNLVFNEIRTEYSKPKVEFLEFLAMDTGNLGAMRLFISCQSLSEPIYEFPPAEVKAGEYIVLHLRTPDESCIDETGPDLSISGGTDAHNEARDLWLPGSKKILHKDEALWLMDQDGRIIDAVILSETSGASWSSAKIAEAAEFLGRNGTWLPSTDPAGAVLSKGTTATQTICRDETLTPQPYAGNWYITASSSATPGGKNSTKRYIPKS